MSQSVAVGKAYQNHDIQITVTVTHTVTTASEESRPEPVSILRLEDILQVVKRHLS